MLKTCSSPSAWIDFSDEVCGGRSEKCELDCLSRLCIHRHGIHIPPHHWHLKYVRNMFQTGFTPQQKVKKDWRHIHTLKLHWKFNQHMVPPKGTSETYSKDPAPQCGYSKHIQNIFPNRDNIQIVSDQLGIFQACSKHTPPQHGYSKKQCKHTHTILETYLATKNRSRSHSQW